MDTFRITVERATGEFSFEDIAVATLTGELTSEQAASTAAFAISQFSALVSAASKDAAQTKRATQGEAFIRDLFSDLRERIAAEADEPEVKEFDPGPEVDDQGGLSEAPQFTTSSDLSTSPGDILEQARQSLGSEASDGAPV